MLAFFSVLLSASKRFNGFSTWGLTSFSGDAFTQSPLVGFFRVGLTVVILITGKPIWAFVRQINPMSILAFSDSLIATPFSSWITVTCQLSPARKDTQHKNKNLHKAHSASSSMFKQVHSHKPLYRDISLLKTLRIAAWVRCVSIFLFKIFILSLPVTCFQFLRDLFGRNRLTNDIVQNDVVISFEFRLT